MGAAGLKGAKCHPHQGSTEAGTPVVCLSAWLLPPSEAAEKSSPVMLTGRRWMEEVGTDRGGDRK